MSRLWLFVVLLIFVFVPVGAQEDALNLPTELYVLLNEGRVERYGLGAAGVSAVTPENDVVIDFGVAPDGVWMAYRTEAGLTLLNMLNGENRSVETGTASIPPFRGLGQSIAWSPDSSVVAYTVDSGIRFYFTSGTFFNLPITPILHLMWSPGGTYLAAEAENHVWWIYRREGDQLVLQSAIVSSMGLAWVEESVLMIAPETGGLALMDLSQANAQVVIHDETVLFQHPVLSGERQVSIFGKIATDNTLSNDFGALYNITLGGTPTIQQVSANSLDLSSLSWSPGGKLMLALRGGVLALVDPMLGQGFALPMTGVAAYGWGALRPPGTTTLTLPEPLYFLADDGTGIVQLWRQPSDGSAVVPVISAEKSIDDYAIAPDGQTVAYISDNQLFMLPAGADTPLLLTSLEAASSALSFSADGQTIAYDNGTQILTMNAGGGEPQILLEGYSQPRYSPSGDSMLLRLVDGDLGLLRLESGEILRLGAYHGASWMRDGRIIVYGSLTADSMAGVTLLDTSGTQIALLFTTPTGLKVEDAVDAGSGKVRLILGAENGPAPLVILDAGLDGQLSDVPSSGFVTMPRLSPDGRFIVGYADASGTLVVVDLSNSSETVLRQSPKVKDFSWVSFR